MRSQIPVDWTVYFFSPYQPQGSSSRGHTLTFQTSIEPRFDARARAAPGPAPVAILTDSGDLEESYQANVTYQRRPQIQGQYLGEIDLPQCLLNQCVDVGCAATPSTEYRIDRFDKTLGPLGPFYAIKIIYGPLLNYYNTSVLFLETLKNPQGHIISFL